MNKEQENQFKENIKEIARLELKNSFNNNLMETLNSAFIFKYVDTLEKQSQKYKEVINKIKELIESKNNGVCIINGKEKEAFTFLLDFDEAREFIWKLLDILKEV